ncbi:hypothetical protein N7457_009060 [Penicillium paradoxum]|uniref:uncharacterized protein n=1 Tax=Penicillium paradoxum TaxID=176176 RepID=UPI0025481BD8|nr:uncharacterized protein N7457_009060 [Penicillium paradoxum]KAJ5774164.1 hypothetical protein N7457_009060 [Penicillium paradoxum]
MSQATPTFTVDREFTELETCQTPKGGSLSITALARFEFEAGKGNDGTKILMIEWEDDDLSRSMTDGSWHVSWAGKTSVLPADERPSDSLRRFYFLLPPNTTIPPVVTLYYEPRIPRSDEPDLAAPLPSKPRDALRLNPLPAIFPLNWVLQDVQQARRKRLRVLEQEIDAESRNNVEGIALHMAISEKEWIEDNFGLTARTVDSVSGSHESSVYPTGPATPVSPVSGKKLSDKLKGLKLQTSEKDLSVNGGSDSNAAHLLSPQSPDVAVSSFSSFRNVAHRHIHSMPTPDTNPTPTPDSHTNPSGPESLKPVALFPPSVLQEAQQNHNPTGFAAMGTISRTASNDSGEDLFAKALSPRSPDLPRSPFSFC